MAGRKIIKEEKKAEETAVRNFVPEKSGKYLVEYYLPDRFIEKELIEYNKKENKWMGTRNDEYYKKNIFTIRPCC